jgi:DNA-binding CsgD family transcriptional regulator
MTVERYQNLDCESRRPIFIRHPIIDQQILTMLAEGRTRKKIAIACGMSHQWVSLHISRIKEEYAAMTDAHLVAQAFRRGVLR